MLIWGVRRLATSFLTMNAVQEFSEGREYGNTPRELRRTIVAGFAIGLFASTAGMIGAYFEHRLDSRVLWPVLGLFVMPAAVMTVAVLPTLFFHIRFSDRRVQHVFSAASL